MSASIAARGPTTIRMRFAPGLLGPVGPVGPSGTNGNTLLGAVGAPTAGTGANGDFYLDTAASRLYGPKAAGAWPGGYVSLVGPGGPQGIQGPIGLQGIQGLQGLVGQTGAKGDTGATGIQGVVGPVGPSGTAWYYGSLAPTGATGVNGDWYLNTATGGRRAPGARPSSTLHRQPAPFDMMSRRHSQPRNRHRLARTLGPMGSTTSSGTTSGTPA